MTPRRNRVWMSATTAPIMTGGILCKIKRSDKLSQNLVAEARNNDRSSLPGLPPGHPMCRKTVKGTSVTYFLVRVSAVKNQTIHVIAYPYHSKIEMLHQTEAHIVKTDLLKKNSYYPPIWCWPEVNVTGQCSEQVYKLQPIYLMRCSKTDIKGVIPWIIFISKVLNC